MTTLRRDLRLKFEEVLIPALSDNPQTEEAIDYAKELAEKLADAALELRGFQFKPQTIEQAIFAGVPVTAEMTKFIRSIEPKGVTISVGGEIGEVGKKNSTVENPRRCGCFDCCLHLPEGLDGD